MNTIHVAVILPTRGLVFTEVEEEIEKMRAERKITVYRSHNLTIPESQNFLVEQAMKSDAKYLFFIEEDTVPPDGALDALLKPMYMSDTGVSCIDYGMHNNYSTVVKRSNTEEILFCGLGMTLVRADIFNKLPLPYFRADKAYSINQQRWIECDPHKVYGHHDIYFGSQIRKLGYKIVQVPGECRHLTVTEYGAKEINNGLHQIALKGTIINHYQLEGQNL